jgi:site-specific DNA recombinase
LAEGGELTTYKIRERLQRIEQQRRKVRAAVTETDPQLRRGAELIEAYLDVLDDPETLYRSARSSDRRMTNEAFFERLYVSEDRITDQTFRPPVDELVEAARPHRVPRRHKEEGQHLAGAALRFGDQSGLARLCSS